jgi:histidinol-phosphate aminotransferase
MNMASSSRWTHGGPDALGAPRFDFSTNTNACGPCPMVLAAVRGADATLYPDPQYTSVRQSLAVFHGVAPARVLLAGSSSEFIFRVTAWAHQHGVRMVHLPQHHYGDYARAAQAWGLRQSADGAGALSWACEPSSPLGQAHTDWCLDAARLTVLDRAYAPLRLSGVSSLSDAQLDQVWQLFTPNKALGLTGVRAAYVIAPVNSDAAVDALQLLAPSWPIGAHGVAMLQTWVRPEVQAWLADCLPVLRGWKARQISLLQNLGWTVKPSDAHYFCAQPSQPVNLATLRHTHGIKIRDATTFGLPGWMRLGVLDPDAQVALADALHDAAAPQTNLEKST